LIGEQPGQGQRAETKAALTEEMPPRLQEFKRRGVLRRY
jgi:hypothetical protein